MKQEAKQVNMFIHFNRDKAEDQQRSVHDGALLIESDVLMYDGVKSERRVSATRAPHPGADVAAMAVPRNYRVAALYTPTYMNMH